MQKWEARSRWGGCEKEANQWYARDAFETGDELQTLAAGSAWTARVSAAVSAAAASLSVCA